MTKAAQPADTARVNNQRLLSAIERRSSSADTVLGPCLASYKAWLAEHPADHLHDLTSHLVATLPETRASIEQRMAGKWAAKNGTPAQVAASVTNSLRRSAGTNYQALVSYAIAKHLLDTSSTWYVVHPVPPDFGRSLSIRFTGGQETESADETDEALAGDATAAEAVAEGGSDEVVVKPDLDILIRNAAWPSDRADPEPVLILSVKTSLADRAGSAARWKTYFDLVTRPCPRQCEPDCAYRRLGIELANDPNVAITHGIVTANIYKMNSDPYFTAKGELGTNQARANTFMFDLRYTTRVSGEALITSGWESLAELPQWLADTAARFDLTP